MANSLDKQEITRLLRQQLGNLFDLIEKEPLNTEALRQHLRRSKSLIDRFDLFLSGKRPSKS